MLTKPKNRKLATILAFSGVVLPISGIHKFYLGQPGWGILYLLLFWTPIPKVASMVEGLWYLTQAQQEFDQNFNAAQPGSPTTNSVDPGQVEAIADALRHLDRLRRDGLLTEYEFEQKRRQLLDRIT